jgi:serine/threonine protein kinase
MTRPMGRTQDVAIKMTHRLDPNVRAEFRKEIEMLKLVSRDRNIVQFYGACVTGNDLWLVAEFMEVGALVCGRRLGGPNVLFCL